MLDRIKNSPNIAGAIMAVFFFTSIMLIAPMFDNSDPKTTLAISAWIAVLAFYKGRRAVLRRQEE